MRWNLYRRCRSDEALYAGEVKEIDLTSELAAAGVLDPLDDAGLEVDYEGPPGGLIGSMTSVDQAGDFSFDTPVKDPRQADHRPGNSYPWNLEGGNRTVLHLKNTTAKPVAATLQFRFEGGTYNPDRIVLGPHQTVAVDPQAIQSSGQIDIRGQSFPRNATHGQVVWFEETPNSMIGRAEIVNAQAGTGRSFSCGVNCPCGLYFGVASLSPASYTGAIGDVGNPFSPQYTSQDCQGTVYGPYVGSASSWTSSDSTVMSITNAGQASCLKAGTTSITAQETGWTYAGSSCLYSTFPVSGSGGGTVVSVQVTTVDLTSDSVTVLLSGASGTNGQLVITWNGPVGNAQIANSTNGPGTYTFNPGLKALQLGQYTGVTATWTVTGKQATGSIAYSFNVLGSYWHTQYNTPAESQCSVGSSTAYLTPGPSSCMWTSYNLSTQFITQAWINGSGSTKDHGLIQEYLAGCSPPVSGNMNYFRQVSVISPGCSHDSLDATTVAVDVTSVGHPLKCNDQVLIVGLGAGVGTVKTATDSCPACAGAAHIDDYNTSSACSQNSLGYYTTIRINR